MNRSLQISWPLSYKYEDHSCILVFISLLMVNLATFKKQNPNTSLLCPHAYIGSCEDVFLSSSAYSYDGFDLPWLFSASGPHVLSGHITFYTLFLSNVIC